MAYMTIPIQERFWAKIVRAKEGCWDWRGAKHPHGYGLLFRKRGERPAAAHRLSYEIHFGPIPPNMRVCHRCDNPPCNNPEHLFLGTAKDNTRDMIEKGRVARGERIASAKLSASDVLRIRSDTRTQKAIAADYGVRRQTISKLKSGKRWGHLTNG